MSTFFSKTTLKRRIRCAFILLAAILLGGVVVEQLDDLIRKERLSVSVAKIVRLSGTGDIQDFHNRIDAVRNYIHANSIHEIDEEFYRSWGDEAKIAGIFLAYVEGRRTEPPHMECSTRAELMSSILQSYGYDVRDVSLYDPDDRLSSHRIIEVRNPSSGEWEAQDPDFNVYWRRKADGERVSLVEASVAPRRHEPCGIEGCGFGYGRGKLRGFIKLIAIIDRQPERRSAYYAGDVDPARVYEYEGRIDTFCGLIPKNCQGGFLPMAEYSKASEGKDE